jgi:hypothetical protein
MYLGALGGAPLRFFAGSVTCDAAGCTYPAAVAATGSASDETITVTARLEGGFGAPLHGDLLYDVSGLTFAGGGVLDSTAPFAYKLAERIGRTTTRGRHIVGSGSIRGGGRFRVDVFQQKTGSLTYSDPRAGVRLASTKITKVRMVTRRHAVISGTGTRGGRPASFVATVVDGGKGRARDSFGISVGRDYRRSGRLLSGGVTIK